VKFSFMVTWRLRSMETSVIKINRCSCCAKSRHYVTFTHLRYSLSMSRALRSLCKTNTNHTWVDEREQKSSCHITYRLLLPRFQCLECQLPITHWNNWSANFNIWVKLHRDGESAKIGIYSAKAYCNTILSSIFIKICKFCTIYISWNHLF
jgi:hypothetical protein